MQETETRRDRLAGWLGALLFHAGLFYVGGKALAQPATYGVDPGSGGMAIDLIAASPHVAGGAQPQDNHPPVLAEAFETVSSSTAAASSSAAGDSTSPSAGTDSITFHSDGGASLNSGASHLRNPAPLYPIEARRLGQEGLVVLVVRVDARGRPMSVGLKQGSGFPLLDDSALATVRQWRFRPAWLGGMGVDSVVEVPIRFVLSE